MCGKPTQDGSNNLDTRMASCITPRTKESLILLEELIEKTNQSSFGPNMVESTNNGTWSTRNSQNKLNMTQSWENNTSVATLIEVKEIFQLSLMKAMATTKHASKPPSVKDSSMLVFNTVENAGLVIPMVDMGRSQTASAT